MDGAAIPQYGQVKLPNSTTVSRFCRQMLLKLVSVPSNCHKGKSGAGSPNEGLLSKLIDKTN
jgi:hypothetical protein